MRKAIYRAPDDEARELLARAPTVHIATTRADGTPMLKTVHAVLDAGGLAFHGAPAGEKLEGLGRPAVASAAETVASIPSTFLDPERACPATTYYVGVQAHGTLAEVTDPTRKARVLAAIMTKYQPEGGYVPIDAEHPLYRKAVRGILVAELRIDRVDGKAKLGQNRTPGERVRVLEQLWRRGAPGDVAAVAGIVSRFGDLPPLPFLAAPEASRLVCHLADAALDEAVALLRGEAWVAEYTEGELRRTLASSPVRVGARDARGALVAFARAVTDGRTAWLYDVVVRADARARGLGRAVLGLLLEHPEVRRCRHVRLTTRDAEAFYERLGFARLEARPRHPWTSVEMIATRDQNANVAPAPA